SFSYFSCCLPLLPSFPTRRSSDLVSYTAGQVLPTSIGGDASRIYETARRHPGRGGSAAGIVLLERALGGAATLTLAAIGFALAVDRKSTRLNSSHQIISYAVFCLK